MVKMHLLVVTSCVPLPLTCMIVIVNGYSCCVVVAQHGFGGGAGVQRSGADLRVADHSGVTEVDVEILVLLEDVVIDHADCDLW